jgi:orotidine-5'-phosphate decarboxylase
MENRERLIVALDLPGREEILRTARSLRGEVGMVKVGLEPFTAHGPDLVRELRDQGLGVFLDLKVNDIPRTAAAAVREARKLGATLVTIHALGGAEMVRAAVAEAGDAQIIAVTLLTSIDESTALRLGLGGEVAAAAGRLGELALGAGAHGLVCSALELERLAGLGGRRVVPGIRPAGTAAHDQKRVATPAQAVAHGATWIVVGRPIVTAGDPVAAARAIVADMDGV